MCPEGATPQSPVHPRKMAEPRSACATVVATAGTSLTIGWVPVLVVGALTVVVV